MNRREFLAVLAAAGVTACTSSSTSSSPTTVGGDGPSLNSDPFTLGVASGDPEPDSVILWTRLVNEGLGQVPASVGWVVATDHLFSDVVASGDAVADPAFGHSVHVEASGLEPDSWYWYRFVVGDWRSVAGRTRTAPADGAMPAGESVRVGFASCQSWDDGYYTAHPHLAEEDLDLVLFLGDYIYEHGVEDTAVRQHDGPEPTDLDAYRRRYALYKSDTGLQAAHTACPWVVTWDDHEVENDYADAVSQDRDPEDQFLARRAAAYQAFYEHMPVRVGPPDGPDMELYRSVSWGNLAEFYVLDSRQYRTDQPCTANANVSFGERCDELDAPDGSMLGSAQRSWLVDGLASSGAVWDVLANQTVMTRMPLANAGNFDQWDGYPIERAAILDAATAAESNLLVLTGDFHVFFVGDVSATEGAPPVATEFVGGSITTAFPTSFAALITDVVGVLPQFPFVDPVNHGYGVLELTPDLCRCDYRAVATTQQPEADIRTLGSWTVTPGSPGAQPA